MLSIKNVSLSIDQKLIVRNLNLTLPPGTMHALVGPNGSGKSSLALHLMGHPSYQASEGEVLFQKPDASSPITLDPQVPVDARARLGLFLAFQQPYEIPGVSVLTFLKESYSALTGETPKLSDFQEKLNAILTFVGLDASYATRNVNEGFSGGQRKRLELAQLMLFKPQLAILDEIDSGLDLEGFALIKKVIDFCKQENPLLTILMITHHPLLLEVIKPDAIHVMVEGTIVRSGGCELAQEIQENGYV